MVLLFALVSAILVGVALFFLREEALKVAESRTDALAHVISEQTIRTFQTIEQRLESTEQLLQNLRASGGLEPEAGRRLLREQLQYLPYVRALLVTDRDGTVILGSDEDAPGRQVADRAYFNIYQRAPETGFYVGPAVKTRRTSSWAISASRPIYDANGSFHGVVVAIIDPAYFESIWSGVDAGTQHAVALLNRNTAQVLARAPPREGALGADFSSSELFKLHLRRSSDGVYRSTSPLDGVDRLAAYRILPAYPDLVVTVGAAYSTVLASWTRFARLAAFCWLVAVAGATALALQLQRQERKRASTELRLGQMAQAMPQIVFVSSPDGRVEFVNEHWTNTTGRPAREALGIGWLREIHREDRRATEAALLAARQLGTDARCETRLRYRDGTFRWQLLRVVPSHDVLGQVDGWYGTATDIDDLKQAHARVNEQAEALARAGRLTRMGGWKLDLITDEAIYTPEGAAVLDLEPGAYPRTRITPLFTPNALAYAQLRLEQCATEGTPFDVELEMVTARGRRIWMRSLGEPVRDAEGRIIAIQGAQQDITDRVHMVDEIRALNASLEQKVAQRTSELTRQEALFRALAEQAPLPIWTIDPQGRVTFLSRAWYALVGGLPGDWHGHDWIDLVHHDDMMDVRQRWKEARRKHIGFGGTRRLRARNGSWHTTIYRATPVRDDQGHALFWVGIDSDVTEIMANEAALRLANEQLEAFSYSVSHDLRSPVERVASFAQLLEGEIQPAPESKARHFLSRIQANVRHMSDLIDGLLTLATVSKQQMNSGIVDLTEMARDILVQLQSDNPQRQVTWQVEDGLAVTGDARLMRSVLENLLGNAWKFTSRQERAEIVVGRNEGRGEFFVSDNGAGFDMAYAEKLFGTFQRLHPEGEFPGTGVGLATVARAILRQGGQVRAEAQLGKGATFFFSMPGTG